MSDRSVVIVGGGLAAARAVEGYRAGGGTAQLALLSAEDVLPYERPPLSKGSLAGDDPLEKAIVHDEQWYAEQDVTLHLGDPVEAIDLAAHTVTTAGGRSLEWSRLLLATGSSPRRLDVPGADLGNVLYLRTMAESAALREHLVQQRRLVVIGGGWIGLEVAAAARTHGCEVTVVEPQPSPLYGVVGPELGDWFRRLHESHGVRFHLEDGVESLTGTGDVSAVTLSSGVELPAEVVVVGVGIAPNVSLAEATGLDVDNGIVCDAALRTSNPEVFAAGDVASWFNPTLGERIRVDHWANALNGGYAAGQSLAGVEVSYGPLPYFFSDQYDIGLEYAGFVRRGVDTEVVFRGDPAGSEFMAFWLAEGKVLAGMHVNLWDSIDAIKAVVGTTVDADRLADQSVPLTELSG